MKELCYMNFFNKKFNVNKFINIFLINIIMYELYNSELYNNKYNYANITLKLKGKGIKNILSYRFDRRYYPYKVIINKVRQDMPNYNYYFNCSENYIELFWDNNNINCNDMFRECYSIYEIHFPNFDTSRVITMNSMFKYCTSLISLNLTNFVTSNVEDMQYMFNYCKLITSLDLSNFDNSKVIYIDDIFDGCSNLTYLNLKNFKEFKFYYYEYIFDYVPQNIYICGNESVILPQITKHSRICYTIDCSDDWKSKQKKMIGTRTCVDSCENDSSKKYEYNGICYQDCINGNYTYDNIKYCKCENIKCFNCTSVAIALNLCNKCNDNYYPK